MNLEENPFSLEYDINILCRYALVRDVIPENSATGKNIVKSIPNFSITEALEQILKPEYANDVFTWCQIRKALNERFFI